MNAIAAVEPAPSPTAIAVRLADEGIPVRAIARSLHIPSADLYELFKEAVQAGTILELPKDDWPPGTTRHQRSPFNGSPLEDDNALKCACARFFKCSPLEAVMLAAMLKRNEVTKQQLHHVIEQNRPGDPARDETDVKMVDVMICKLRKKLKPHDIHIETMWGLGYLISARSRDIAIGLLSSSADPANV